MMTKRITKVWGAATVLALALSVNGITALAAENYSYLTGQQKSQSRNELYVQAAAIESEEERTVFLAEHGIADTPYSEDEKASYSYVTGRQRGSAYKTEDGADSTEKASYSYLIGQQRGSSYAK